nr:AraC family transcriptional regulator [Acetobacter persici]
MHVSDGPVTTCQHAHQLLPRDWGGPLIQQADAPRSGSAEPGKQPFDGMMVWIGGPCDVELVCDGVVQRWRRTTGMVDLLPAGCTVQRVEWDGAPMQCSSLSLAREGLPVLAPGRPRFGVLDPHLLDLAQRLAEQARLGQPWGLSYVRSLTSTLRSYLTGRYGECLSAEDSAPRRAVFGEVKLQQQQKKTVLGYIEEQLANDLSVSDLAQLLGYSPDYFSRLFKCTLGLPPNQYVIRRRIERAKMLLRSGSLPIAEIALMCGFATQTHLHEMFKRHIGMTPAAYRRCFD